MLPHPDPFKILLFSIFSLASRLWPHEWDGFDTHVSHSQGAGQSHTGQGQLREASEMYFAQAKALIGA